MTRGFQPEPTVCQKELINKAPVKICDLLGARLELLFGTTDKLTLSQVPSTTIPKEVLQNSTMNRRSYYMVGTRLSLITLQDIQLNIQMAQEQRSQWQTHPGRKFYGQLEVHKFYSIMGMGTKNKLT